MDSEQARSRLEAERERLTHVHDAAGQLAAGAADAERAELSSVDQHPADTATETFERELDSSVLQRTEVDLAEVEAALRRLDEGRYGLCEVCGKPIGAERLEAMPATRYCVDDQARAERDPSLRPIS